MKRILAIFFLLVICASLWAQQPPFIGQGAWLFDVWGAFRRWDQHTWNADTELQRKAFEYTNYIQATIDTTRYFDANLLPNNLKLRTACYRVGKYLDKNFNNGTPKDERAACVLIIEALEKKQK
jgi:hypothetical protein